MNSIKIVALPLLFIVISCDSLKEIIRDNDDYILRFFLEQDKNKIKNELIAKTTCNASRKLLDDKVRHVPVYTNNSQGACTPANIYSMSRAVYYSDQNCQNPVAFSIIEYSEFCKETFSTGMRNTVLGNAALWTADDSAIGIAPTQKWTISYGSRMKLITESINNNFSPYMKKVNYKTINNIRNNDGSLRGTGTCKLEMRVYKKDITADKLKPLLAIHGGSWKSRIDGFPGLEASISHFTEQGFIVFAPFYRLAGNKEGNIECSQGSWRDLVSDVEDALKWVWQNGNKLGAMQGQAVALSGQSAGGHLAGWLLTHPERHQVPISRALLLYPVTDFKDFIEHSVTTGRYEKYSDGLKTIENFLGDDITTDSVLKEHSFPALIRNTADAPPVFIIHGVADNIVPSMQSVRLCNAYDRNQASHNYDLGPATNDGGDPVQGVYMKRYICGSTKSELHLLAEADHAFDLECVPHIVCFAGSRNTIPVLNQALKAGREWLMQGP